MLAFIKRALFNITWMALFSALLIWGLLHGIEGEVKFQESIRAERCSTGKYPSGYCDNVQMAER